MKRLQTCFATWSSSARRLSRSSRIASAALAASVALIVAASPAQAAGDVCIGDSAKQTLAACPNNGPGTFNAHGKAPALNFHTAPQPADLKKRDQQTKPNMPSEQMSAGQRDDRKSRLMQRAKGLLVGEIGGLENLLSNTPGNSPDRLQLVRRLAEDYVELENAGFTEKTQAEIKRDDLKKTNPSGASQQQAVANQANTIMLRARGKAEQFYTTITTDFPNYPQLDEVLYYLAYEYEQGNNNDMARKTYFTLIQSRPNSKYIPNAYLAFGELFFNEAQGDPSKWGVAQQAYQKVIGFPPKVRVIVLPSAPSICSGLNVLRKVTVLSIRALSSWKLVSLSSYFGGSNPANRAAPPLALSVTICTCRPSGNISGNRRLLINTAWSILRAAA